MSGSPGTIATAGGPGAAPRATATDAASVQARLETPVRDLIRGDITRILVSQTVGEALAQMQRRRPRGRIVYFYVVDAEGRLCGVLPTRGLLLNPPETPVADLMIRRVVKLPVTAVLADACELFMVHRLLALPVVDAENHLLGILDVEVYTDEMFSLTDEMLRAAGKAASDDVFQLIGVRLAQVQRAPVPAVFWRRFPWLLATMASGLLCATVANLYEGVLQQAVVLAMFIPMVLAIGESVGMQSLTLTLQAQHGSRVRWRAVLRGLVRELPVGLLLGLSCGVAVGVLSTFWGTPGSLAVAMGASVLISGGTAALLGLLVPASLLWIQRDPKVASGPITLALADLATLIYFFSIAAWALP